MENYLYYDLNNPTRFGPFMERWLPIKNFEDRYSISDYGRVSSSLNGILKCNRDTTGYVGVTLHSKEKKRRVSVHILTCEHFIPNPENKPQVNHKKGFRHDNFVGELEWVTAQENILHAFRVLQSYTNPNDHMKKYIYIHKDGVVTKSLGIRKTARDLNIPYQAVQGVLKGHYNAYKGYFFTQDAEYVNPDIEAGKLVCNKCHEEKDVSQFHKKVNAVMHTCATCRCAAIRNKTALKRLNNLKEIAA